MPLLFRVENPVEGAGGLPVSTVATPPSAGRLSPPEDAGADTLHMRRAVAMPQAVTAWLQDILRERFNADITLRETDTGHHELSVPGLNHVVRIRNDYEHFERNPRNLPCGRWTPGNARWLPQPWHSLPAPGMAVAPTPLVTHDEHAGRSTLHYDVLGLTYWMLSRREEVDADGLLDANQRFPAEASHAWRHGYLDRPIVDEWMEVLRRVMQAAWPGLPLRETHYSLWLTHDVDTPARYGFLSATRLARAMCADIARRRPFGTILRAPSIRRTCRWLLDTRDPYNTFDWIMQRSEQAGLRSTFFFICGRTDPRRDAHYRPEDPAIIELMQRIHVRGHEIGLHPSYHCHLNPQALCAEADRLREACARAGIVLPEVGARMHYLRWSTPATLHALTGAGLAYDATLGYAKQPGFRCGTCHEYPAFDPVAQRALPLRIRPLIVMESTVIGNVLPETVEAAEDTLQRLMEAC
ncbi:MAG TPA: polysaccharide deacetylase family protein, partial [Burkholderiaceae bacterium]|nr:polysaccharide deacetylase family protein [Burkholderiaceae bacterium]